MHPEFTARNAAKFAVKAVVAWKTKRLAAETIENNTGFEKDDMVVDIGTDLFGWYISSKVSPYTDKAVDKAADFVNEKIEARRAKKNDTKKD